MFARFFRTFGAISLLLFLGACATPQVDPNDTTRSVVYGYIDMDEAPSSVDWVFIMDYNSDEQGFTTSVEDGIFYHVGIPPGPYQVDSFGRNTRWWSNTSYTYEFGSDGRNQTAVRIKRPGIYYMGAYKYVPVDTGWFEPGKFEMKKTSRPSEREILEKVLELMEANNPEYVRQIGLVRQRLAQFASTE